MLEQKLQESGEILENILTKPLSVKGLDKNVSLYEAAKKHLKEPSSPELKKLAETFLNHPETLQIMLQELNILAEELS